ncbi:MAG: hypothetical protein PUP92_29325 [Rhizonema sp. PD38]|nr:hypothetical protein [Rhizonema sp. PD38]
MLLWFEWQRLVEQVRELGKAFLREPEVLLANTSLEHAKFYLEDPSNNVIEIKAYRNFSATLKQQGTDYNYEEAQS